MTFLNLAAILTILTTTVTVETAQAAPSQSQPLYRGDYTLGGHGQIRRLLVSSSKEVVYDIWRATPGGTLEHLHFTLIPPGETPVESNDYVVKRGSTDCGHATLQMYRGEDGQIQSDPAIIKMTIGSTTQPLGSFSYSVSASVLAKNDADVAQLKKVVDVPGFYDNLTASVRDQLTHGVPICDASAH